jgi:hypothetical protein
LRICAEESAWLEWLAYLACAGQARDKRRTADQLDEDFRAELADMFAQVLLLAEPFNVDLSICRSVDRSRTEVARMEAGPLRDPLTRPCVDPS